jgi:multidrug efflux pump subunit AcrA (membrane-fusion protein)
VAVFDVTEKDYARLQPGQTVRIASAALPGRAFDGAVARVAPRFDETSRQARVEVDVPNAEGHLKPGLFVSGQVDFARHADALLAPLAALARRQGSPGLFVVEPDGQSVRFVPVAPGIVSSNAVEILSPAVTGRVVTLGQHLLENMSRIQAPDSGGSGGKPGAGGKRGGAGKPGADGRQPGKPGGRP